MAKLLMRRLMAFFTALLSILFYASAGAAEYQAGFRTLGAWTENPATRLDLNVWYPCKRSATNINITPWIVYASHNARCAEGKFPLLALSHPTSGTRFSYHDLGSRLARAGFVVVAPTHARDCVENMDDLFTWNQLKHRVEEINEAIRLIVADASLGEHVERNSIGIIGFGAGGTAALLMGGALPNCETWQNYRKHAGEDDPYADARASAKIDGICAQLPLKSSLANPDVRAVAAVSPGFGMLFNADSFKYFYPAALLVSAGREKFNRSEIHVESIARALGKKARFLDLPDADTGALMADCPPSLRREMAELCLSAPQEIKTRLRGELQGALVTFFKRYLQNPEERPQIPAPPDLNPSVKAAEKVTGKGD